MMNVMIIKLQGVQRWFGVLISLSVLSAGCLNAGPGSEHVPSWDDDELAASVTLVTNSEKEVSIVRNASATTVRITPDAFALSGEIRQYAIRATEVVNVTLRNSAINDNWGGKGGCAFVGAQHPAPFAGTLVFGQPSVSYYEELPTFGQFHIAWGGGGHITMRGVVDGTVVVDDGIQLPRPPLLVESTRLGHQDDNQWTGEMGSDTWLLLMAGGFRPSSEEGFEWNIMVDATGELEVYRLPPSPVQCGLWANDSPGSTDVTLGIYSVARDLSMSMRTNDASTLYVEHFSRDFASDPTSAAIHRGSYYFLGAEGEIVKNSVAGERTVVHCFASAPGDMEIHFDEVIGSSTVIWFLADTAFLPFSREPVCANN